MRDKLKDMAYFEEFISRNNKYAAEMEQLLSKLSAENKDGIFNAKVFIQKFYRERIMSMYSSGSSIDDLKPLFEKMLSYAESTINNESGNFETTELLALAVLFDVRDERLLSVAKNSGENEKIFDIFLHYLNPDWTTNSSETIYKVLLDSAYSTEPEKNLIKYLSKNWYREHRDAYWYNSARSEYDIYCGYWAMEVAAIVKILDIPDEKLKNCNYYPYDMVHFSEKEKS